MIGIRQNILATLAYYDVLDLPLTTEEVLARLINFKHLQGSGVRVQVSGKTSWGADSAWNLEPETCTPAKIQKELDQLILDGMVGRAGEYSFLFDREYLVPLRIKREKIARCKWQKTKRAIRWLRFVPYIKAVFASGSLAINNTDELSDLDVLMVVGSGRIWLTRFLVTALLSILGMRRQASDQIAPDKICLNHYIGDASLAIPFKSIYNAQTYSNLVPIYVREESIIEKFKNANDWVLDFIFNWNVPDKPIIKNGAPEIIARLGEVILDTRLGDWLETLAKRLQYQRIARNPATRQPGGRVIFNDEQLEFHPRSIETSIIKKYNDNLVRLGVAELAIEYDSGLVK